MEYEKQMTKGPGFGPEGVCKPAELHTYKTSSYKEEVLQIMITPSWKGEMGGGKLILEVQ